MKKIILFSMLLFILNMLPLQVKAEKKVYTIDKAEFYADLLPDGSAEIQEIWTVHYQSGEFHRFYKDIHQTTSSVETFGSVEVKEAHINGKTYDLKPEKDDQNIQLSWNYTAKNETVTYDVTYTVKDVVKQLNDCYVFSYRFVGNQFSKEIKSADISISAPGSTYFHEYVNGMFLEQSDGRVYSGFDRNDANLNAGNVYALTLGMNDTDYFQDNLKKINQSYADLDFEQIYADTVSKSSSGSSPLIFISIICIGIVVIAMIIPQKGSRNHNDHYDSGFFGCSSGCSSGCGSGCGGGCGGGGAD